MSFVAQFNALPMAALLGKAQSATPSDVKASLHAVQPGLHDLAALLSTAASQYLETMARKSHALTLQRFGKVIRLFAPLYLSNECINNCQYCGFSRDNPILRVTLSLSDVMREAQAIKKQGFRNLLLVAGEHPRFVSNSYLADCVRSLRNDFPSVNLEVGPMEVPDYRGVVESGADGLVVYQETYDRNVYAEMHTSGPKRNFDWRLETAERGYAAGFRRIGIGALLGLTHWRQEILAVAAHAQYLQRHCWTSFLTISLPRLRPHAGPFQPRVFMSDAELTQVVCALRIMFPDVGLVLSTREHPALRDGLMPLGITLMSAGSHTEPGGYTGVGQEKLHLTTKGRIVELNSLTRPTGSPSSPTATVQFDIADHRSPEQVVQVMQKLGYEPVWKDWDAALTA